MTQLILIGLATLVIGLVVGVLVGRSGQSTSLRQRRLEQQIDELRSEYTRYQAQVNEHFMESAHLMRRLNDVYRDVSQHMARGANRLCHDEDWLHELEKKDDTARLGDAKSGDSGFEPPRDYAPKSDPKEKGTLAEDYGLREKSKTE
ncbi:DUF1043 family protein [Marinobacter sp. R17]|uniref:YhcB family protein n=1 Tax=Marinobacter TaxID=2742 RepID=UPI000F4CC7D6|nr:MULTISPECIES: DUF1043 family protein [Marinobacter]ROU01945.1 DUF1043 family protein [Marinobacter sp. R17]